MTSSEVTPSLRSDILEAIKNGDDVLVLCQSCSMPIPVTMAAFLGGVCRLCFVWKYPDETSQRGAIEDIIDGMVNEEPA